MTLMFIDFQMYLISNNRKIKHSNEGVNNIMNKLCSRYKFSGINKQSSLKCTANQITNKKNIPCSLTMNDVRLKILNFRVTLYMEKFNFIKTKLCKWIEIH